MKRIALVASMALTLCAGTLSAEAHGCWRGGCFWPFWSFGLGWGLGAAYSYPAYRYSYPYPAYSYYYPPPVYAYNPPVSYAPPAPPATPAQPAARELEPQVWVPSSPGPGKWVPDPEPYRYVPPASSANAQPARPVNPQTATSTTSPGGVPIHVVQ
ncbi:MAG TPA: hypothetical protein VNZ64_24645 [Candidatus Acidoferrum sp.]|nr:hypothetical protein [Candidatus Acidoferrum sp.]